MDVSTLRQGLAIIERYGRREGQGYAVPEDAPGLLAFLAEIAPFDERVEDGRIVYTQRTREWGTLPAGPVDDAEFICQHQRSHPTRPGMILFDGEAVQRLRLAMGDADNTPPRNLVTLQQAATMVKRSKRTLEKLADLPKPVRKGKRGQPHQYSWKELRPVLERAYMPPDKRLPDKVPTWNG